MGIALTLGRSPRDRGEVGASAHKSSAAHALRGWLFWPEPCHAVSQKRRGQCAHPRDHRPQRFVIPTRFSSFDAVQRRPTRRPHAHHARPHRTVSLLDVRSRLVSAARPRITRAAGKLHFVTDRRTLNSKREGKAGDGAKTSVIITTTVSQSVPRLSRLFDTAVSPAELAEPWAPRIAPTRKRTSRVYYSSYLAASLDCASDPRSAKTPHRPPFSDFTLTVPRSCSRRQTIIGKRQEAVQGQTVYRLDGFSTVSTTAAGVVGKTQAGPHEGRETHETTEPPARSWPDTTRCVVTLTCRRTPCVS